MQPRWRLVLTGMMFVAGPALATAALPNDEAELRRLSVEWMQALEAKDAKTLEAILASDYVLQMPGDPASRAVLRAEWLRNALGMDWSRAHYENLRVRVNGDHALVTARLYFHVSPMPIELDSTVMDTWERRDGRWQVTDRYLGDSAAEGRLRLIAGFLAALLLAATGFVVVKLSRRIRARAASRQQP